MCIFLLIALAIIAYPVSSWIAYAVGHWLSVMYNWPWLPEAISYPLFIAYQKVMAWSVKLNDLTGHGPWL